MSITVVFVHGWSVTDTSTYGRLPEALAAQAGEHGLNIEIEHVWLGRYISFHDEVTVTDVARAFHRALRDTIPAGADGIAEFSCVTHSTGGPVVREWLEQKYGAEKLSSSPLRHLVMLAPANHGSALAALGKTRVGRINAWFNGVEPGQRILDWLSLGSRNQVELSARYIDYNSTKNRFYPFVLTGESIDKKFYDFINSYLVEPGSDGVVRVAAANLNYSMVRLVETKQVQTVQHGASQEKVWMLKVDGKVQRPLPVALGVIPKASHSGAKMGIMASVTRPGSNRLQVGEILKCFRVKSKKTYDARADELAKLTEETQRKHRYTMLVFLVKDDQGNPVTDFDLFLLGGKENSPEKLSKGFFVDRQQNAASRNHLVYYIDYDVIIKNQLRGFRIIARPAEGFAYYHAVEYRAEDKLNALIQPNEAFYVEIQLRRCVDKNVFRFDGAESPKLHKEGLIFKKETRHSFKGEEPMEEPIDD